MRGGRGPRDGRVMIFLKERINRIFEETFQMDDNIPVTSGTWSPPVDLYETESEFVVKAEVPEVKENDLSIRLEANILTIEGERRLKRDRVGDYHRIERSYGRFKRSFILPEPVEIDTVKASLKDGVLKIILPKKRFNQKQIEIID